jgi:hypothetical protein
MVLVGTTVRPVCGLTAGRGCGGVLLPPPGLPMRRGGRRPSRRMWGGWSGAVGGRADSDVPVVGGGPGQLRCQNTGSLLD